MAVRRFERLSSHDEIEESHIEQAELIADHLGLPDDLVEHIHDHIDELVDGKAPVIWVQGQNCTGCTVTLMDSDKFNAHDLGFGKLSLRYQPDLMAAEGKLATDIIAQTEKDFSGQYVVVLEGAIPTGDGEEFCTFGTCEDTIDLLGNEVPGNKTIFNWLLEAIPGAKAVLAVGNCASYGGIPMMEASVTGATSATDVVEAIDPTKPVINVAGCPPHADWVIGTLICLLLWADDHIKEPNLDERLRLGTFYEAKLHDMCERRNSFEAKDFLTDWNDIRPDENRCLLKMGCKGPSTHADCPRRIWSPVSTWCVGMNAPCSGCTEPGFSNRLPHLK